MQWLARRLQIFGVHVHVGVRSPDKAIPIVNALTAYVPAFPGAVARRSPYLDRRDTGLASARVEGLRGPADRRAALPALGLGRVRAADGHARRLRHHRDDPRGVVGHPPASRLRHRRAADLRRAADSAGDRRHRGAVPVPGRPAEHPARPGLHACPSPKSWVVRENKWRAARYGLDAELDRRRARHHPPLRRGDRRTGGRPAPAGPPAGLRRRTRRRAAIVERRGELRSASARSRPRTAGTCTAVVDSLLAEMRAGHPRSHSDRAAAGPS